MSSSSSNTSYHSSLQKPFSKKDFKNLYKIHDFSSRSVSQHYSKYSSNSFSSIQSCPSSIFLSLFSSNTNLSVRSNSYTIIGSTRWWNHQLYQFQQQHVFGDQTMHNLFKIWHLASTAVSLNHELQRRLLCSLHPENQNIGWCTNFLRLHSFGLERSSR